MHLHLQELLFPLLNRVTDTTEVFNLKSDLVKLISIQRYKDAKKIPLPLPLCKVSQFSIKVDKNFAGCWNLLLW